MRQYRINALEKKISILTLDDDQIMTSTIQSFFKRAGYDIDVENNPLNAVERIRNGSYDILLLDFLMSPICGNQVVERIREFNKDISIIMLTGHKDMAPPLHTMRSLDIQGYYEKSDRFDQLELLVESCVKSIKQLRTIRDYRNGLNTMLNLIPELYQQTELDELAESALRISGTLIECVGGIAAIKTNKSGAEKWTVHTFGQAEQMPDTEADLKNTELSKSGPVFDGSSAVCPLEMTSDVSGFLALDAFGPLSAEQKQLICIFVRQLSAAIDNALLNDILKEKNVELDAAYKDLGNSYTDMIATVRRMVDEKDIYTRHHSDRVSFYAVELAKRLGKDDYYCSRLKIAGLFHDIGKIGIPDHILQKPDSLTDDEREKIKSHSARGARILSRLTAFRDIVPWICGHHERYDGSGYPDCLAGDCIPEQARIITVADAFDAITSDRRYRIARSPEQAFDELDRGKGSQFDPVFAAEFIAMIRDTDCFERAKTIEYEMDPLHLSRCEDDYTV